jgi:hypothetical protein
MPTEARTFEFVVEKTDLGWMILNAFEPIGPFYSREQAVDLAEGMAAAMRQMGDRVVVRVKA